jgi:hypothetical protein
MLAKRSEAASNTFFIVNNLKLEIKKIIELLLIIEYKISDFEYMFQT